MNFRRESASRLFLGLLVVILLCCFNNGFSQDNDTVILKNSREEAIYIKDWGIAAGRLQNSLYKKNASFQIMPGLSGTGNSFQARYLADYYLVASREGLTLSFKKSSDSFRKAASFVLNRNGDGSWSVQSVRYPDLYLCLQNGKLEMADRPTEIFIDSIDITGTLTAYSGSQIPAHSGSIEKTQTRLTQPEETVSARQPESESGDWVDGILEKGKSLLTRLILLPGRPEPEEESVDNKHAVTAESREPAESVATATPVPGSTYIPDTRSVNLACLSAFTPTDTVTSSKNLLRQLYGSLNAGQQKELDRQFDDFYAYQGSETREYLNKFNAQIFKAVSLKTQLNSELIQYGMQAAEAFNACDYENEEMAKQASDKMLQARSNIMSIGDELEQVVARLNDIGDMPDPRAIQEQKSKEFDEIISSFAESLSRGELDSGGSTTGAGKSFEGLWALDLNKGIDSIYSSVDGTYQKSHTTYSEMRDNSNNRYNMGPFSSDRMYLKTLKNFNNGMMQAYLYLENSSTGEDDAETGSILGSMFGGDAKDYGDDLEWVMLQSSGDNTYVLYSDSENVVLDYRIKITVKEDRMDISVLQFESSVDSGLILTSFSFVRQPDPSRPPTLKNGNWDWDSIISDMEDESDIYSELSESEKSTPFEELDDEAGIFQRQLALFRYKQNMFETRLSRYKGRIPSVSDSESLVWTVKDVKLKSHAIQTLNPEIQYSMTSNLNEGWIKIWQSDYKTEGENWDSEGESRMKDHAEIASFSWKVPTGKIKDNGNWNINLHHNGLSQTRFKAVLPATPSVGKDYKMTFTKEVQLDSNRIPMDNDALSQTRGHIDLVAEFYNKGFNQWETFTVNYEFALTPANPAGARDIVEGVTPSGESVWGDKEAFHKLKIQEINEDIDRYRVMKEKATTAREKDQVELLILGKQADLQHEKDMQRMLKTGEFRHTPTKWDQVNLEVSANRFIKDSAAYQKRLQMIEDISDMSGKLRDQGEQKLKDWAQEQMLEAARTSDTEKIEKIRELMQTRYMANLEKDQINAELRVIDFDDYIERAEKVKGWSEFGVMAGATGLAAVPGIAGTTGAAYLPTVISSGYVGITNGISDGPAKGAKKALASINAVTMVVESAYDGYNQIDPRTGEKRGFEGAKTHAMFTVAILGACHVGINSVIKGSQLAKGAFDKVRNKLVYAQERKAAQELVERYESKIKQFKEMVSRGESAAAKQQMKVIEQETQALMANPHAKNMLKYNGSKVTTQYYKYCENKVKDKVLNDFMARMEKRGWSKFKLREFRNASSGSSVGMDWDVGLVETQGMRLSRRGAPASVEQWQRDAAEEFERAYRAQTGFGAEESFANITSTAHNEAFKDVAILTNPANASFEFAEDTAETVRYKSKFMLSNHSRGYVSEVGKYCESCRGLAKEIRSKMIPNLKNSRFKLHNTKGVEYFSKLENILDDFGTNKIGITEAERKIKDLTGKSLEEIPDMVADALQGVIAIK